MSIKAVAWPEPDPVVASAVRRIFRGKDLPLAVAVRDEFGELFSDELFAEAFQVRGRPAWSPGRLALVTVLQKAENLTDRAAAAAVASRLDWRYALGLGLDEDGFDASVLSEFRGRVVEHHLEEAVLGALLTALEQRGLVKGGGRGRTDSTHVVAAVRDLNRLELAGEAVRAAVEALAAAAPGWLSAVIDVSGWSARYEHRVDSWSLPSSKTKRDGLAAVYGRDGLALLAAVFDGPAPGWLREVPAVETLRVIMLQNYTVTVDAQGREVVRRREAAPDGDGLPPGHIRLTSPYDIQARRGVKKGGDLVWNGYKLHVSETCDSPDPEAGPLAAEALHVITNVATTAASVPDALMTASIHDALADRGLAPGRHLVDSGYPSAQLLAEEADRHNITIVAPMRVDTSRQARAGAGFARDDFAIDFDHRIATCPMGNTSTSWTPAAKPDGDKIVVSFSPAQCRPCPALDQCTTSTRGRRQLTIPTRAAFEAQRSARAAQPGTDWHTEYHMRAGVEGTIDQIVHVTGSRRTRYRGLAKTHASHIFAATAINLVRWNSWAHGRPLDRTRTRHLTRLQTALAH